MYSRPGSACDKMLRKKSCISAEDIHFLQSQSRETPTQGLYIQGVPEKTPVKKKLIASLTGVFWDTKLYNIIHFCFSFFVKEAASVDLLEKIQRTKNSQILEKSISETQCQVYFKLVG